MIQAITQRQLRGLTEKADINVRQILYVKDGERGIRQSDGVFQHIKVNAGDV